MAVVFSAALTVFFPLVVARAGDLPAALEAALGFRLAGRFADFYLVVFVRICRQLNSPSHFLHMRDLVPSFKIWYPIRVGLEHDGQIGISLEV